MKCRLMLWVFTGIWATIGLAEQTRAFEPQNPISLCERFVVDEEKNQCNSKIKSLSPDWYAATACGLEFDDSLFYGCLESAQHHTFSPRALEKCIKEDLNDEDRLACVKSASTEKTKSYQSRSLASSKTSPGSHAQTASRTQTMPRKKTQTK